MYALILLQLVTTTVPQFEPTKIEMPHTHQVEGGAIHYQHGTGVFVPTPAPRIVVRPGITIEPATSERFGLSR